MSGPYVRIATAADVFRVGDHRLTSPEHLIAWQRYVLAQRGDLARQWNCVAPTTAFVYMGNWGTACPHCTQRMYTHPEWRLACCIECGAICRQVIIPADYREIERVLLDRPDRSTQNWSEPERLADLVAENAAHGVAA
jgi:hypothetical protein